ncbi:MAG: PD-(D/E)XK nuclease family protein, partial [Planctomycetales bacterium]|nr:PD-(D/E)XK nuclease family protein [Planctomycetales bacterium]
FRSSPVVIDTVNRIFEHLQDHENLGELASAVVNWQRQFNRHQTARAKYNGYTCLQAARRPNDDEPDDQKQTTLRYAAEEVARLSQLAPGHSIGVLVRRNEAVRQLIFHLRDLGIDASEEGGNTLLDSAAVRVLLSLIQLADHPGDQVAAYHLETSPLANDLHALAARPRSEASDDESTDEPTPTPSLLQPRSAGRVARLIRRQLMSDGYGPTIYYWSRRLADACNQRELRRLEKLLGLAYAYEATATTRPRDFLRFVETQKVRDPSAADVRVMTVHQSKGLQFDIVVVTELETDLIGQRDQLVTGRPSRTSPIDRVCRRASKEVRALLPESWQRLFTEADELDMAESLCVLYVAVTRAIHALHLIVGPSSETERSLHKTFGGLVRAALTDGERIEPQAIAFEHGDKHWYENPGVERTARRTSSTAPTESLTPLPVRLAAPAERRSRNLERVSPSGLEGGSRVKLSDVSSDDGIERSDSLRRGTLIHAWFEQILWIEDGLPESATLKQLANEVLESAISDEDLQQLLDEFQALLGDTRISGRLSRTAYPSLSDAELKVENERPIAVREGNRLLVGNIDRLVTAYDRKSGQPIAADILDFKTDIIMPGDEKTLNKKVRYYQPQLQAYRRAVQRITNLPPDKVTARLLFTYPRRVMSVDDRTDS